VSGAPDDAIVVSHLSKGFKKSATRREYTSFKSELIEWVTGKRRRQPAGWTEVLKDISFTVPRGKTVGIVGRNGSGKSTLLKLITGIYAPTSGTIAVNGRISALLDLGAGFHPDFTGRENIMINGIILGMSREELVRRTPEIIAFSELGDFVDEPVRTYSSGMFMRLAFAVAVHVDPEILIIDEILAVGDEHFARKSRAKMEEFRAQKKTLLLVTHDLATLQSWCDLAVWIDGGQIRQVGDPHLVVQAYRQAVALAEIQQEVGQVSALSAPGLALPALPPAAQPRFGTDLDPTRRSGDFGAELSSVRLLDGRGAPGGSFDPEDSLEVEISFVTHGNLEDAGFEIGLRTVEGLLVYQTSTFVEQVPLPCPLPRQGQLQLSIPRLGLLTGEYLLDVSFRARGGHTYDGHSGLYSFSVKGGPSGEAGVVRPPHGWTVRSLDATAAEPPPVLAAGALPRG